MQAYLWLQYSLCAASIVQADALVHAIVRGEVITHLVAVATALVLRPAVGAALRLGRLLQQRGVKERNTVQLRHAPVMTSPLYQLLILLCIEVNSIIITQDSPHLKH